MKRLVLVGVMFGVLVGMCLVVSADDPEPYHYWYTPNNSLGNGDFRVVNHSYFRQLFRNNFEVNLYYRVNGGNWQLGNEYLGVTFDWQDEGYWKINTSFDNPSHQTIDACFDITMKRNVLNYVERNEHYEYWLNYSIPGTDEVYNCFINWSDLTSIPGIQVTKFWTGNEFTLRFYKMGVPYGYHVFDPRFGEFNTDQTSYLMFNRGEKRHGYYVMANGSGTGESMSFYIAHTQVASANHVDVFALLYEWVDNSSSYAGDLLGYTEYVEVNKDNDNQWFTADFTGGDPTITSGTKYYLAIGIYNDYNTGGVGDDLSNGYNNNNDPRWYITENVYGTEDPWVGETYYGPTGYGHPVLYLTYVEDSGWSNTCPTITSPNPANSSTGISLYPSLNATITDADGNNSKITWATNESGSWVNYQVNNSILNASVMDVNASWADSYSTKYFWRIYANDTHCNASETFHFTTMAEPWSNTCPVSSSESPANKSTGVNRQSDWSVVINDADGNTTSGSIDCSNGEGTTWSGQANGTRTLTLSTLAYNTNFTVWLNFTDGHCDVNETYWFITEVNTCPTFAGEFPDNETNEINLFTYLNVTVSDNNADSCTVTFATNESGVWVNYQTNLSVSNASVMDINASWADAYSTKYWWRVYADDGNCNTSITYWFETVPPPWANNCPVSSGYNPANGSTGVALCIGFWNVTINDADGNTTNGSITCSNGDNTNWMNQPNGTRSLALLCLNYSTNYTVWLNFTDGHCDVNETYWFITVANTSGGCNCSLIEALEVRVSYLENMTNSSHGDFLKFLEGAIVDVDIGVQSGLLILVIWALLVFFLHKNPRQYVPVSLILGLSQFVLTGLLYTQNVVSGDLGMAMLVAGVGFLLYALWKTYKGLKLDSNIAWSPSSWF